MKKIHVVLSLVVLCIVAVVACGEDPKCGDGVTRCTTETPSDAGLDAGTTDAGVDAGVDSGTTDAGSDGGTTVTLEKRKLPSESTSSVSLPLCNNGQCSAAGVGEFPSGESYSSELTVVDNHPALPGRLVLTGYRPHLVGEAVNEEYFWLSVPREKTGTISCTGTAPEARFFKANKNQNGIHQIIDVDATKPCSVTITQNSATKFVATIDADSLVTAGSLNISLEKDTSVALSVREKAGDVILSGTATFPGFSPSQATLDLDQAYAETTTIPSFLVTQKLTGATVQSTPFGSIKITMNFSLPADWKTLGRCDSFADSIGVLSVASQVFNGDSKSAPKCIFKVRENTATSSITDVWYAEAKQGSSTVKLENGEAKAVLKLKSAP